MLEQFVQMASAVTPNTPFATGPTPRKEALEKVPPSSIRSGSNLQSNNNWPQQHTHASIRQHGTPRPTNTSGTPTNSMYNPSRMRGWSSSGNRLRECRNRRRHSRNARIL
mmetsp:Transcript_35992/g.64817  ORF Transcript_35992/g.64817 Transcript_35992/m.64817 type:complete len:110 (+) Transcript_35992:304-633(+)